MANKQQLTDRVATKLQLGKKSEGTVVIDKTIEAITEALAEDGVVQLAGFGVLRVATRSARVGINPLTREQINIPERKTVTFKAGKLLKSAMNVTVKATKKVKKVTK
jgi:DNA-binding protein HU-beta